MITTARVAKFLQRLPDADAAALLDAVARCAADPLDSGPRCKKLAPGLFEARVSLPPSRQFRCMFSYRRDGQPVVLSGVLKTSNTVHERAIRTARAELAAPTLMRQESAMPKELPIFTLESGWLYSTDGRQLKIVHMTRRKVVVVTDTGRVTLSRSRLEQDGQDVVNDVVYRVSRYALPIDLEKTA